MRVIASVLLLGIAGCAGQDYPTVTYRGVQQAPIEDQRDTWQISDNTSLSRLMVKPSASRTAGMVIANGLSLGTIAQDLPKPEYQDAAEAWLARTGRACRITDGYSLGSYRWEFRYRCD